MKKKEKGITLIALVITIIVLLILAGVSIATLTGDSGILTQANNAKLSTELANYKEELDLYIIDKYSENMDFIEETLTAGKETLVYNTQEKGETGNIKTIIKDLSDEYLEKLEVIKGKLLINTKDKKEIKIAQSLGIEVNPYDIVDGELLSSDGNLLLMDENTGTLTIPDSVTSIGEGAFGNLSGLKRIIIPGTVKTIKANAFINNADLEEVILGDGVEVIGDYAFMNCKNLKKITLPDSITSIGVACFKADVMLDNVKLPAKLKSVAAQTFQGCSSLKNLELPQELVALKGESLHGTPLTKIKFPPNLREIDTGALAIPGLKEIDTSENNYYEFKNDVLYTKDLKTLVTALSYVTTVNIENSVEVIKGYAFSYCNKLSSINLTENVRVIEILALNNANLKKITVDPNNKYFSTDEKNNLYNKDGTTLYRLFDTGDVVIRDGVKNIARGALVSNIKSIILPESYVGDKTTDWGVFPILNYLYLPKNVNTFSKYTYFNVKNIEVSEENEYFKSINNEYILSKDGTELYWVKTDKLEIDIPESVKTIKHRALYYSKAETIRLPKEVTKIESTILSESNTKRIEIQSRIEEIDKAAFSNARNLTEVIIQKEKDSVAGAPWGNPYGQRAIKWMEK